MTKGQEISKAFFWLQISQKTNDFLKYFCLASKMCQLEKKTLYYIK